jgi:hypothetical protein
VRTLVGVLLLAVLTSTGCSGHHAVSSSTQGAANPPAPQLVRASGKLLSKCRAAASAVSYPVPCPTRVPADLTPTRGSGGCQLDIIGPGGIGGCAKSWRGWVIGSSETPDQHLVITASPRALGDFAKVVNGPAWYPAARVRVLRRLTINGWQMEAVYVPPETNEGSAFARHVVLIWTVSGHTYGIGFHNVRGLRQTLALDTALARGIRFVTP